VAGKEKAVVWQCGRPFTEKDLEHVREVVALFPRLAFTELTQTLCEQLGWSTASGGYKLDACRKLLEKMEARGELKLPVVRSCARGQLRSRLPGSVATAVPAEPMTGNLSIYAPVHLVALRDKEAVALCVADMERHHFLGYRKPIGCFLHYAIESARGRLGYLIIAGAAKQIGVRDPWIGWDDSQRLRNLPWVVNNSRFLLFPWVHVRYGASHVLGQLAACLPADWEDRWGYRPVLLETFVDPARHKGTCYRAAGWIELGRTTGTGLCRPGRAYQTTPKLLFVRPLTEDFRSLLCGAPAPRRTEV
jgi:hypothetical protein